MRNSLLTPVAAGVLLALAGTAQGATKMTTFQVSATVVKNCVMSAAAMNLGTFDGTNNLTGSSNISINCTAGTPFTVDLNAGSSGSYAMRTLKSATDTLNYNLYTTSGYTTVWGDKTGATGQGNGTGAGMAAGQVQTLTVFGRLLATDNPQSFGAGTYTDTITATITY
ncbi:MAG TPA: spore coat U domain-containing protein [Pseudomonadales bacterium]|nr:spore coat U domain-containing protein [Pseudomonadales bacterium]